VAEIVSKSGILFLFALQYRKADKIISIAQRDAARKRFEEKRNAGKEDKIAAGRERASAIKDKDKATMDMFQQMAKARFG
jgi:hypothetical protein